MAHNQSTRMACYGICSKAYSSAAAFQRKFVPRNALTMKHAQNGKAVANLP